MLPRVRDRLFWLGIDTLSGRLTASEAAIQVLTRPVLILGWGLAVAAIVAFA